MKRISCLFMLFLGICAGAQEKISGVVYERGEKNMPLPGANVYWLGTQVGTVTDFDGKFDLPYKSESQQLVVSYIGFTTDTVAVRDAKIPLKNKMSTK